MKKSLKTIVLCFLVLLKAHVIIAQDKSLLKSTIVDITTLLPETNQLNWIKTNMDFAQEALTVEQIDIRIDSIIYSQRNKNVEDIITPINRKKLKYYGFIDFKKLGLIGDNSLITPTSTEYGEVSSPGNVFQYDNFTFLSTFNAYEDQLHVYALLRAVLILKVKYPDIYKSLFANTEITPLANSSLNKDITPVMNVNVNRHYVFSIHQNNQKQANATTSNYSMSYRRATEDFRTSDKNVHLILLNKTTLRNGGAYSLTTPLYPGIDVKDARIRFLFDGILQMIVHERMHDYISNNMTVNKFLKYIREDSSLIVGKPKKDSNGNDVKDSNGNIVFDKSTYTFYEEPIVTNTANILLSQYGGISKEIMTYYENLFKNNQLSDLKKFTKYNDVKKKFKELNTKSTTNDDASILRLYF